MDEKPSISVLMARYRNLCQYCDDFFSAIHQAFPYHMQCIKGCASCCILKTVMPIEAFAIGSYLESCPSYRLASGESKAYSDDQCVFLFENSCTIYPSRPIICRTHGLPLLYPERDAVDVCALNFSTIDLDTIDHAFLFKAESITVNLIRLNIAFCFITQNNINLAGERIPLEWLITGKYKILKDII